MLIKLTSDRAEIKLVTLELKYTVVKAYVWLLEIYSIKVLQ